MSAKDRRPIFARDWKVMRFIARIIARIGITPNQISVLSIACSGMACVALVKTRYGWPEGFALAALFILLRLLCNMFDGMVAVEHGKQSPSGGIYNELPDRLSDILILMGGAWALGWAEVGLWAALLAVLTAYVRTLSTYAGAPPDFSGPMAKQQRMFTMIAACLGSTALPSMAPYFLLFALALIIIGSAWTCLSRTFRALRALEG